MNLTIDEEFQSLIPALTPEEKAQLEANLIADGCRDPLVVWGEENTLIDGHNRYEICTRNGIEFNTEKREFDSRESVVEWIVDNQVGRRNLNASWLKYFMGREYRNTKKAHGGDRKTEESSPQNGDLKKSAEIVAEKHGTSKNTVERAGSFSAAVDVIAGNVGPEFRNAVLNGTLKLSQQDVQVVSEVEPEQQREIIARGKKEILQAAKAIKAEKAETKRIAKYAIADKLNSKPLPPPTGRFNVVVIDPPWNYGNRSEDESHRSRNPYPSMGIAEIQALPIDDFAEENCILWLWTTNAFLHDAFECVDAWGFTQKTVLTWAKGESSIRLQCPKCAVLYDYANQGQADTSRCLQCGGALEKVTVYKPRFGTGDWLRGQTEHCIMAVKGKPIVTLTNQTTLLQGPLREHSRKPDSFFDLVNALCPGTKLEMFCREAREGWQGWGIETEKFNQ